MMYLSVDDIREAFSNISFESEFMKFKDPKAIQKKAKKVFAELNNKIINDPITGLAVQNMVNTVNILLENGYGFNIPCIYNEDADDGIWRGLNYYIKYGALKNKLEIFPEYIMNDENIIGDKFTAVNFNPKIFASILASRMFVIQDISLFTTHDGHKVYEDLELNNLLIELKINSYVNIIKKLKSEMDSGNISFETGLDYLKRKKIKDESENSFRTIFKDSYFEPLNLLDRVINVGVDGILMCTEFFVYLFGNEENTKNIPHIERTQMNMIILSNTTAIDVFFKNEEFKCLFSAKVKDYLQSILKNEENLSEMLSFGCQEFIKELMKMDIDEDYFKKIFNSIAHKSDYSLASWEFIKENGFTEIIDYKEQLLRELIKVNEKKEVSTLLFNDVLLFGAKNESSSRMSDYEILIAEKFNNAFYGLFMNKDIEKTGIKILDSIIELSSEIKNKENIIPIMTVLYLIQKKIEIFDKNMLLINDERYKVNVFYSLSKEAFEIYEDVIVANSLNETMENIYKEIREIKLFEQLKEKNKDKYKNKNKV